jgi:hypothetical protein
MSHVRFSYWRWTSCNGNLADNDGVMMTARRKNVPLDCSQLGDNRRWRDDAVKARLGGTNLSGLSATTGTAAPAEPTVFERVSRFESQWAERFAARQAAEDAEDVDTTSSGK